MLDHFQQTRARLLCQVDLHVRLFALELKEKTGQIGKGDRARNANADDFWTCTEILLQVLKSGGDLGKNSGCPLVEQLAGIGQAYRARGALKETDSEGSLHPGDLASHRALRQGGFARGACEVSLVGNQSEEMQFVKIKGRSREKYILVLHQCPYINAFLETMRNGYSAGAMADKQNRYSDNVPGAWYVDTNCIICGMCSEGAPSVFKPTDDYDHNYVYHQPVTPEELAQAEEVRNACPADAIGNDGD